MHVHVHLHLYLHLHLHLHVHVPVYVHAWCMCVCVHSFPELWIPFLRESPAARAAKIVVMGDVVTCPGGFALDEQVA